MEVSCEEFKELLGAWTDDEAHNDKIMVQLVQHQMECPDCAMALHLDNMTFLGWIMEGEPIDIKVIKRGLYTKGDTTDEGPPIEDLLVSTIVEHLARKTKKDNKDN
ncbi:MAG: hypothetical protein AAB590_00555 [Patescibacteria group bacterium]